MVFVGDHEKVLVALALENMKFHAFLHSSSPTDTSPRPDGGGPAGRKPAYTASNLDIKEPEAQAH
jgi:hypothetical protein